MRASWTLAFLLAAALLVVLLWPSREPAGETPRVVQQEDASAPALPSFATAGRDAAPRAVAPADEVVVAAPGVAASGTELVVRHADGAAARGCVVALAVGDDVAWTALADAEGHVRGRAVAQPAVAWVSGATLAPASFPLPDPRGLHELVLPAGEDIDGRVEVDGQEPPEPLFLGLQPRGSTDVPERVAQCLRIAPRGHADLPGGAAWGELLAEDGSFRFSGLPVGWQGQFDCGRGYVASLGNEDDNEVALAVRAPEHGRVLQLHRVPRLHFRVVSPGAHEPVPFAEALVICSRASGSMGTSFTCDADGRGQVPMSHIEPTLTAQLELASPDKTARVVAHFDLPQEIRDVDLGDVPLDARWSIPFRVTELDGTPIEGAIAGVECGESVHSDGTAADGTGRLVGVPPGCAELLAGAAGHEMARVPLPAEEPVEPVVVALRPCATLSVKFATADGQAREWLTLALAVDERLSAADLASSFRERALRLGQRLPSGASGSANRDSTQPDGSMLHARRQHWHLRDLGDIDLGRMEPGTPISLRLVDSANHALWSDVVTLAAGEHRVLSALIAAQPLLFELDVTDEAGNSLEGVDVTPRGSGEHAPDWSNPSLGWETDATGHVALGNIYAPLLDVSCEKEGFLPATLQGLAPGIRGHLSLKRGVGLIVHCVGADGRPAIVSSVEASAARGIEGQAIDPQLGPGDRTLGSSSWRLEGLPPGPVTLEVRAGGREFSFEQVAAQTETTLTVPASGALVVRGLQAAKQVSYSRVALHLEGAEDTNPIAAIGLGEIARDEVTLPLVFPGRYRVELKGGGSENTRLAGPAMVDVRVGETSIVVLH